MNASFHVCKYLRFELTSQLLGYYLLSLFVTLTRCVKLYFRFNALDRLNAFVFVIFFSSVNAIVILMCGFWSSHRLWQKGRGGTPLTDGCQRAFP